MFTNLLVNTFSIHVLSEMKEKFEVVVTHNNEQATKAKNMSEIVSNIQISLNKSILMNSDEEKFAEYENYKKLINAYEQEKLKIPSLGKNSQDNNWYTTDQAYQRAKVKLQDIYLAILESRDSDAIKKLKDIEPDIHQWIKALSSIIELQRSLSAKSLDNTKTEYEKYKYGLIISSIAAILIAITISTSVRNVLMYQIGDEPKAVSEMTRKIGNGNLTMRFDVPSNRLGSLISEIEQMQVNLINIVNNVRSGANAVAQASTEIALGNQDLNVRTVGQANTVEQTTIAMDNLDAMVKENASLTTEVNCLAIEATNLSCKSGNAIAVVIETMQDINAASEQITNITSTIDSIAFQTNILALNAAVEAARAEDKGRGFAVVASEVRSLARRSSHAANEIKQLTKNNLACVNKGNNLVRIAEKNISETMELIQRVSLRIEEINKSCEKQSEMFTSINHSLISIDKDTQQNLSLVDEIAASSKHLRQQAEELVNSTAFFQT